MLTEMPFNLANVRLAVLRYMGDLQFAILSLEICGSF